MTMLRFVNDEEEKSIAEQKKRLRARMKERRGDNENRDVKEMLLIENVLAALKRLGINERERRVFCYLSYSSEAPTDNLIERLIEEGYSVYCPRVAGKEMEAVLYGEDFTLSRYHIREPLGEAFEGEIQAAIVPFLAVDGQGNRLGYGGGYYDRFFEKNPYMKRIAYGFDFQVVERVPIEGTDKPMHCIVTDKKTLYL